MNLELPGSKEQERRNEKKSDVVRGDGRMQLYGWPGRGRQAVADMGIRRTHIILVMARFYSCHCHKVEEEA